MKEKADSPLLSRIAPTPSGFLHSGNAFSFVLTWLLNRKMGGKLLLRIDDSDAGRSRPEFIEDIFYTLDWLELDYDLGPEGPGDFAANYSQHHRMELYDSFLNELKEIQDLIFSCSCSRKEIQLQGQSGLYSGTCRTKGLSFNSKNASWRIRVPGQIGLRYKEWSTASVQTLFPGQRMGDFVVRRKDGLPSYQLVSVVDDIYYGVNFIVRGSDLIDSTAAQLYLAHCLGSKTAELKRSAGNFLETEFFHHPLLLDDNGQKLSKSKGAASVHLMREQGMNPVEVYRMVARFCGLPDNSATSLPNLLDAFQPASFQQKQIDSNQKKI